MSQELQQSIEKEIVSSLKVGDKGWNIQLFEDQSKISGYVCSKCKSVCCDAVELGCDHNDDDIFLYCNCCLNGLVKEHNNKCPIDGHDDPLIIPTRTARRTVSKSIVFCPYSESYKISNNQCLNNNDGQIVDTLGGDEKEGAQIKYQLQNEHKIATLNKKGCVWRGTLNDLINTHILECIQKNNPSFSLKIKIKEIEQKNNELKRQNITLKNVLNDKENEINNQKEEIEELKRKLNDNQISINQSNQETIRLCDKIKEQNAIITEKDKKIDQQQKFMNQLQDEIKMSKHKNEQLIQDIMDNKDNIPQHEEKKNDDNTNPTKQNKNNFEFFIPKKNEEKLKKLDNVTIKYGGGYGITLSFYWCMFGPLLKGEDMITVQFKAEKKGKQRCYEFGFATAQFNEFDQGYPNHVCSIGADTRLSMKGEFANINDENEIEKMLKPVYFFRKSKLMIVVNMEVDMKQRKGWLWTHDDKEHKVQFNLPEQVQIILMLTGTEGKLLTANNCGALV